MCVRAPDENKTLGLHVLEISVLSCVRACMHVSTCTSAEMLYIHIGSERTCTYMNRGPGEATTYVDTYTHELAYKNYIYSYMNTCMHV